MNIPVSVQISEPLSQYFLLENNIKNVLDAIVSVAAASDIDEWFNSPLGSSILDAEQKELALILPKFCGDFLVKIGGPNPISNHAQFNWQKFLSSSQISNKICLIANSNNGSDIANDTDNDTDKVVCNDVSTTSIAADDNDSRSANVIWCNYHELPLLCDSVDVVVIHHALEFDANPRVILREAYQALVLGGHMVLIGFNPCSLWGIKSFFAKKNNRKNVRGIALNASETSESGTTIGDVVLDKLLPLSSPWQGKFVSLSRIHCWLKQLNFTQVYSRVFYFRPPWVFKNIRTLRKLAFLDKIGSSLHLPDGACYIVVAEKAAVGVDPLVKHKKNLTDRLSFGYLQPHPSVQTNRANSQ